MAITTKISTIVTATKTGSDPYGGPSYAPTLNGTISTVDGTGSGQADIVYTAERVVGDGANDDIDLAGVLTDAFGATITFVTLVSVTIVNAPISGTANTTDLTIGDGANPFLGFLGGTNPTVGPLKPGAAFQIAAADAAGIGTVTPATADILRVANSAGAAATYKISIIGRSA